MKKILITFVTMVLIVTMFACTQPRDIDPEGLAEQINEHVQFEETLMKIDLSDAERLYQIEAGDVENGIIYVGTGATVDEFSIWAAKDSKAAERVKDKLQSRIDAQKQGYLDYKPEEVPKLDNAVVVQSGNLVILCISENSENAKKTIDDYIK